MNKMYRAEGFLPNLPTDAEEFYHAHGPYIWPMFPVHIVEAMNELVEKKLMLVSYVEYKDGSSWKRVQVPMDLDAGVSYRLVVYVKNVERQISFSDIRVKIKLLNSDLIKLFNEDFSTEVHHIDDLTHATPVSYPHSSNLHFVYFKLTGLEDDSGIYPELFQFDKSASFIPSGKHTSTFSWVI